MAALRDERGHKFGELISPGVVEISCRSGFCGAGPGIVVLHQWDVSGEDPKLLETRRFREIPGTRRQGG